MEFTPKYTASRAYVLENVGTPHHAVHAVCYGPDAAEDARVLADLLNEHEAAQAGKDTDDTEASQW